MATNPIPKDTVTIGVNVLKSERNILQQLALNEGRSLGKFVRLQILNGLRTTNPQTLLV